MKRLNLILFVVLVAAILAQFTAIQRLSVTDVAGNSVGAHVKDSTAFGWMSGILSKQNDGNWYLRMNEAENVRGDQVRAFPWRALGMHPSATDDVTPFPLYPRGKYERDGHPYPVGTPGRWFGLFCSSEQNFEDYIELMLTIQRQLGEDPPGSKPAFEGVGFYIVTGY